MKINLHLNLTDCWVGPALISNHCLRASPASKHWGGIQNFIVQDQLIPFNFSDQGPSIKSLILIKPKHMTVSFIILDKWNLDLSGFFFFDFNSGSAESTTWKINQISIKRIPLTPDISIRLISGGVFNIPEPQAEIKRIFVFSLTEFQLWPGLWNHSHPGVIAAEEPILLT